MYLVLFEHLQYARNWNNLGNAVDRGFPRLVRETEIFHIIM